MTVINFRQLIDAAIGSPDPGHVNFYALHCLLYHFADKLKLLDTTVDDSKSGKVSLYLKKGVKAKWLSKRLLGGADEVPTQDTANQETTPAEENQTEAAGESNVEQPEIVAAEVPQETPPQATGRVSQEKPQEAPQVAAQEAPARVSQEKSQEKPQEAPQEITQEIPPEIPPEKTQEMPLEPPQDQQTAQTITTENVAEAPAVESVQPAVRVSEVTTTDRKDSVRSEKHYSIDYGTDASKDKTEFVEAVPEELMTGIQVMKDQIEIAMEQLNILANIMIKGKTSVFTQELRKFNNKMKIMQKDNIYIEARKRISEYSADVSLEHLSEETFCEEEFLEESEFKKSSSRTVPEEQETEAEAAIAYVEPTLDYHLCYPPEKIMDQFFELKSEFCTLTNKVNDIMKRLLEQESQRTNVLLAELQEQMREVRQVTSIVKDGLEFVEKKQRTILNYIDDINDNIDMLQKNKVDRQEMEILLAEKADNSALERKVSLEQMREMLCRIEKQFCEVQRLINFNEKHALQVIENMRQTLGLDNVDQMLKDFRNKVDEDILKLQSILQNYLDSTNDECAAAGARIKVLKDLACLSCDTSCVMRVMEKSKVGKLPDAHATPAKAPLITYEIGAIRKSGIMGYYRKDEFPHTTNAWLDRQKISLKMCAPRHAGGEHTTHTAKEIVQKVVMNKRPK